MKDSLKIAVLVCALLDASGAAAESVKSFYRGKTIDMTIGVAVGGSYDLYGRTIAEFLSRHVPGHPTIVVRNMPGAGGIVAAQHLANSAPKDGTEFGTVYRGALIMPLLGLATGYDPLKFNWLGSPTSETAVCETWHTSPIKTFEQALHQEVIMGSTAQGADLTGLLPPLKKLLKAKFKIITGYEGGAALDLAMSRGEIAGRCGVSWSALVTAHPEWLRDKKINIILQLGYTPLSALKGVPMAQDFTKSKEDKDVLNLLLLPQLAAYPFFLPAGVPADRVSALRAAFNSTLHDPDFVATAKKINLELAPVSATEIGDLIKRAYASSPKLVAKARSVLQ